MSPVAVQENGSWTAWLFSLRREESGLVSVDGEAIALKVQRRSHACCQGSSTAVWRRSRALGTFSAVVCTRRNSCCYFPKKSAPRCPEATKCCHRRTGLKTSVRGVAMRDIGCDAPVRRPDEGDGAVARRRERVLFELAKRNKADVAETFRAITEAAAVALDVERTSIWRLLHDGSAIVCEDDFVRAQGRHGAGDILAARDYPSYFSAIAENRVIAAHEVRTDVRTRELSKAYLEVHSITSMMDVPIWHNGRLYGVLCHEHVGSARRWTSDEETFAGNLADLASLALEESEREKAERRWDAVVNTIQEAVFVVARPTTCR